MESPILFQEINNLLYQNYKNNIISEKEYLLIKSKLTSNNNLSNQKLIKIYNMLMEMKNNNYHHQQQQHISFQQNQINFQQNLIGQQQNQINTMSQMVTNQYVPRNQHPSIQNRQSNTHQKIVTNNYSQEENMRSNKINIPSDYNPRIQLPNIQTKNPKNNMEHQYQKIYTERNQYNQSIIDYKQEKTIRFVEEEEKRRNIFITQQKKREYQFKKDSNNRRNIFEKELKSLEKNNLNPYKILDIPYNFTLNQLTSAYKKKALKYHPDRPNGDKQVFQILTKSYMFLMEELKKKQQKGFNQMKNDYSNYSEKQDNSGRKNMHLDKEKFNLDVFNKLYTENRLHDPNDEGYGDLSKSSNPVEKMPKIFSDKFNINVFNSLFNNQKDKYQTQEIIKYSKPVPTRIKEELNYSNIGEGNIDDFSGNTNSGLRYTDYKKAHDNSKLINTKKVKFTNYKNIDDLEKKRSNIKYKMNTNERIQYDNEIKREKIEELNRIKRKEDKDIQVNRQFKKINNFLIRN